ncbi:MAG: pyridoxamine 5'-phosphate oxidase family protein [Desulfobacterales bacterium]|nr:pyridoxamine 5'-phosphate oxidase family protein [Desulfobacterales bacterium]
MSLSEYFENTKGIGVLATADSSGNVDVAVYTKPYFEDDQTVSFIMADRLSYGNLQSNPKAAYLFKEEGKEFTGKRLFLTKIKENDNADFVNQLMKEHYPSWYEKYKDIKKYQVFFKITKQLPLVID